MEAISDYRFSILWLAPDKYKHGDLYGMCYLSRYKEAIVEPAFKRYTDKRRGINLYILHDSYLQYPLNTNNFDGIDSLEQIDYRSGSANRVLDPVRRSVLIIETAQRYATDRFRNAGYFITRLNIVKQKENADRSSFDDESDTASWLNSAKAVLYNPNINTNLEFNLFDYSLFTPVREMKADLNYCLFHKLRNELILSRNNKYLMLKETADPAQTTGIYQPIPSFEMDSLLAHMDQIRRHFLSCGFTEVCFSVIPNTITVVDSSWLPGYPGNRMMPAIKAKTESMHIPYIDVYPLFLKDPAGMYKHGDSHWTNAGKQVWIDEVNKALLGLINKERLKGLPE
jgi:hypothetical protein